MQATQIHSAISILCYYTVDGNDWIEVPCADYDELKTLAKALEFQGKIYGRTAWNSDSCKAYYRTGWPVAFAK